MGPAFYRWLKKFNSFQTLRSEGGISDPWKELKNLESEVDSLALEGLDSRAAASCLLQLERSGLFCEERNYEESLRNALDCEQQSLVSGVAAELFHANRYLIIGNVYLIRDGNALAAADYFQQSIDASGEYTVLIRGNAAINLGICQSLLGDFEQAIESYEMAAEAYEIANRRDKVAIALHSLGNAQRSADNIEVGIRYLHKAIELYKDAKNNMGLWSAADDLSRAYLSLAPKRADEKEKWLSLASKISDFASAAGTEVWNVFGCDEGRLADLSDQMLNHTATRLEICVMQEDPMDFLGTLALMKGRIRHQQSGIANDFLLSQDEEVKEVFEASVPWGYFQMVAAAIEELADGRTVALLDQFAIRESELLMGYAIIGQDEKRLGGFHAGLVEKYGYDPPTDFRGRQRGIRLLAECENLVETISRHGQRCAMVIPDDATTITPDAKRQLEEWSEELRPSLEELGEVFFPSEVLTEFRRRGVEHVILCVDPLFAQVPYAALLGSSGPIVNEAWTYSLVTASTEVFRILERKSGRGNLDEQAICWLGPDPDVNQNRGGNREVEILAELAKVEVVRNDLATLEVMRGNIANGRWCHFRGHGRWTGSIDDSGPVLADNEVLSSSSYPEPNMNSGFLFTAACLTGFGDTVGAEIFGSLVDYDRAGLLGAVLTCWPIDGEVATIFAASFYAELRNCNDAARSLKVAYNYTRDMFPHPYLWAPFSLLGAWDVDRLISWKN